LPKQESVVNEPAADEDEAPAAPAIPQTMRGDVYTIGSHRLMCGDSTLIDDVDKLMDGAKADMVFTDPPYGMNYKGVTFGKDGLSNDGENEWEEVLRGAVANLSIFAPNALWAVCFGCSRLDKFFSCFNGITFKRVLTIYKPNRMAKPWRGWILTSELICLFENGDAKYNEINHKHDVYTHDYSERPDKSVNHPTVKPVSICEDVISKGGKDIVLDLFGGSGSTMVAAHKLGRTAYLMELDEKYCDVIVQRMAKLFPDLPITRNGIPFAVKVADNG
jgi:DNA modification methylase